MSEREPYLWDRSGEPDRLVVDLEAKLARFRHRGEPPAAEQAPASASASRWPRARRWGPGWLALAAVLLVAVGAAFLARRGPGAPGAWEAVRLSGSATLAGEALDRPVALAPGARLETGSDGRVRLAAGGVGEVEVAPGSRVRLLASGPGGERLALDAGRIFAAISSPPQVFSVATPAATAIDLGCYFVLEVDDDGGERLRVEAGWVALVEAGREAFVPGGAVVETRRGRGLGTPVFLDAPRGLRAAVGILDGSGAGPEDATARRAALGEILAAARPADALTLWHLLARTAGEERLRVHDRLATLVPPPGGVTRDGIAAGDPAMLDAWWEGLGLGSAAWWRNWRLAYPTSSSTPKRSVT